MDAWTTFITMISDPNSKALLTVAGLGLFLKLVLVPLIKWFSLNVYPKKEITGAVTVVVVQIAALITVIIVTIASGSTVTLLPCLLLAWAATKDALGLQDQATAILRSDKMKPK